MELIKFVERREFLEKELHRRTIVYACNEHLFKNSGKGEADLLDNSIICIDKILPEITTTKWNLNCQILHSK